MFVIKSFKYLFLLSIASLLITCSGNQKPDQDNDEPHLRRAFRSIAHADTITISNAPSRITRKIRKNHQGGLIFSAFEDIMIYDGEKFTKIPHPEGYNSFDAFEDSNGNLWIASTKYGVFRYDVADFTHFTTEEGLAHDRTMDILEDDKRNVWFATMGGLSKYDGISFSSVTIGDGLPNNDINTIVQDGDRQLWIGTRRSAVIYDLFTSSFTEIRTNTGETLTNVWSIIEDQEGNIWLINEEGIWIQKNKRIDLISTSGGSNLFEDSKGNIWLTGSSTLSVINQESILNNSPSVTEIYSGEGMFFGVNEDANGNIWVGTLNGVFSYDGISVKYYIN